MILKVEKNDNIKNSYIDSYDVIIEKGALNKVGEYFDLNRKVLIVTEWSTK